MKNITFPLLTLTALATLFAGCESMGPNAEQDAAVGGLGGAAIGGAIGSQNRFGLGGALVGGAVGALAGAAIGDAQDQRNAERIAHERQLAAEEAEADRARAEADRARLMSIGYTTNDPAVIEARQRAEAAEARAAELRRQQEAALERAREIEAYRAREAAANQDYQDLQRNGAPPPPPPVPVPAPMPAN